LPYSPATVEPLLYACTEVKRKRVFAHRMETSDRHTRRTQGVPDTGAK
jgi:hypothetical protein